MLPSSEFKNNSLPGRWQGDVPFKGINDLNKDQLAILMLQMLAEGEKRPNLLSDMQMHL